MKWIHIDEDLPNDREQVIIFYREDFDSCPPHSGIALARYSIKNKEWITVCSCFGGESRRFNISNQSYKKKSGVTHWLRLPELPSIKFDNKKSDCEHDFYNDIGGKRYCYLCGLHQTLVILRQEWGDVNDI